MRMQIIDDEGMRMAVPGRRRALAPVRIVIRQVAVVMFQDGGVVRRPDPERCNGAGPGKRRHHKERDGQSSAGAEPAGERIADKPAGVGQRKLRGIK